MLLDVVPKVFADSMQDGSHSGLVWLGGLLFLWVAWRIWRFTLQPLLYPNDPKELPYVIPYVGHAISFFRDSDSLISNARRYFKNSREPFALSVGSMKTYILLDPRDVSTAYSNDSTLSIQIFIEQIMHACGASNPAVRKMFASSGREGRPSADEKPLMDLIRTIHTHNLSSGLELDKFETVFVKYFAMRLSDPCSANAREFPRMLLEDGKTHYQVPLLKWLSEILVSAGQELFFGEDFARANPEMLWDFLDFDDNLWQLLYRVPGPFSRKVRTSREKIRRRFEAYFRTPVEARAQTAWFTRNLEMEMRSLGIPDGDIASMILLNYWGANTNTRKATFWLLTLLLQTPHLIPIIRSETSPAFSASDPTAPPSTKHIEDHAPTLSAAFDEALRLTSFSASVRHIRSDTALPHPHSGLNTTVLRKGNLLLIPYRQLHFDTAAFGPRPEIFDPERFLRNKRLLRSPNLRPFGGGSTYCPGRMLAKRTVLSFVAMLLRGWDISVIGAGRAPRPETRRVALGVADVRGGEEEWWVDLVRRDGGGSK